MALAQLCQLSALVTARVSSEPTTRLRELRVSKSTGAVILTSPTHVGPWGDDAWRFTGAMQLVIDGPDWLHADWTVPGPTDSAGTHRLAAMVLRDAIEERAADIAVMALALLDVAGWRSLESWWGETQHRDALEPQLGELLNTHHGKLKLAFVETASGALPAPLAAELRRLGFVVMAFAPTT